MQELWIHYERCGQARPHAASDRLNMDLGLRGRRALVTGGTKGIGAAIARRLAEEGCDLVLVARTATDLEAQARRLRADTRQDVAVEAVDLSQGAQVIRLAQRHGDVYILINNAGALPGGPVLP